MDGKSEKNQTAWLHFKVGGYLPSDSFTSRYGPTFSGNDYNGIVNFRGDAKGEKIDEYIQLLDEADDYHDVLRPSATYQTSTKPAKKTVKPKFGLQGYDEGVEGFFLYHDAWKAT